MKKILSLFTLLMTCVVGMNAQTTVKYALAEGDTFTSGQTVEVKNGDAVVATITYGESAGTKDFTAAQADSKVEGYAAYTPGNGENGNKTGGTFYTITPKVDATISVAVVLNANKAFYIEEDGTALEAYNGITVAEKYYGTYEFDATANKAYKVYCAGSKLGFYGFEMTFTEGGSEEPPVVTNKTIGLIPGVWVADDATFAAYAWNDAGNAWFPFAAAEGAYATQIPDNYTGISIVRLKPATAEGFSTENNGLNWTNKWNQTADIDFTAVADNTVFIITGWGENDYTTLTELKAQLERFVNVAKGLGIDTTDAETLIANDEATVKLLNDAMQALLGELQQKAKVIVDTAEDFFNQFDTNAANALTEEFAAAKAALEGTDFDLMRTTTTALAAKCLEEGKNAMEKVDTYLRKMEDETLNDDLDALKLAIAAISNPNEILNLLPAIQKLKDDMTTAAKAYMAKVNTLISEGSAAGKDVSAVSTAFINTVAVAANYQDGKATLVEMGTALYELIKAVEAFKEAVKPVSDGTYYVMSAQEGYLINAENALDAKGTPITFTFNNTTLAYTIEGADIFAGKQWTIADAVEGMSGYYTISTPEGFLAANATALEQIADGTADAAVWILLEKAYWEDIVNSTYTIAGTKNLTGTENDWDIVETNQMTLNDKTGLYEKKFKKIAIDGDNQPEFKVVQTNMEGENIWYPENNWVITTDYVGGEGLYDITITFDPSDFKEIGVIAEKRIVFPENAIVYDFEAAADAGENPENKNGSAANGQAFFGWENPEKTDSKRQDYRGYEWAEGSVLPEVCHVWRRSDRINGNVAGNGGLKCPSIKEMAIDGLNEGDKVIIVYDAENATDKEIIWAIGDGSSDETLTGPRATATINGVEAVSGETTIASGAEIVINSVTPAENGSGYIVFQVKKGMVIKQIAVIPAPEEVPVPYYLVGTMTNWADEGVKEDYNLTLNTEAAEGVEEYMITLDLTTADQFKIVKKDGETLTWYPGGEGNNYGQNGEITEDGNYTVYFRPNGDGGSDWFYNVIYVLKNSTNGINAVDVAAQNAVIYNLSGQKVMKAQKGLYIVNGKKMILK